MGAELNRTVAVQLAEDTVAAVKRAYHLRLWKNYAGCTFELGAAHALATQLTEAVRIQEVAWLRAWAYQVAAKVSAGAMLRPEGSPALWTELLDQMAAAEHQLDLEEARRRTAARHAAEDELEALRERQARLDVGVA